VKIYGHIGFWVAAVAVVLAVASMGASADDVKAGGASSKQGRAVNDSPAKSEGASNNSGRVPPSIESNAKSGSTKKQSGAVKAGPASTGGRNAEAGPVAEGDSPRVKTSKAKQ
jgi:hypothetical protein